MKYPILTLFALLLSYASFAIYPITGSTGTCPGGVFTLTDFTPGGTWSSGSPAIATVGSATGTVTGVASGIAVITYTVGGSYVVDSITVYTLPAVFPLFSGSDSICAGGSGTNLYLSGSQTGVTYQLFNGGVAIAAPITGTGSSIGFGMQTDPGYFMVTATDDATGCTDNMGSLHVGMYDAGPITGATAICLATTSTLSHSVPGGAWSSSDPAIASVGSATGIVTGNAIGTATITYNIITGCVRTTTVNVTSALSPISGSGHACLGSGTSLSDASGSGTWVSSNTAVATVGSGTGMITGVTLGAATITFSIGGTCGYVVKPVTVNALPNAYTLFFGSDSICSGGTGSYLDLSGSQPGVYYQLFDGTTAWGAELIGTGGGLSFGSFTISGTFSAIAMDTAGCYRDLGTATLAIFPGPGPITGTTGLCTGAATTLSNAVPGGTWSSSNTAIAMVSSSSGVVTGVSAGSAIITYTVSSGCHIVTTVNVSSSISAITGPGNACIAQNTTLADAATGGFWTSSNPAVATVGASTGIVTGVTTGNTTITYTIGGTCGSVTTVVTVDASPAGITGISSRCMGATTVLYDVTAGGVWSSVDTAVATISATGFVTSISPGLSDIYYTAPTGCKAHTVITIDANPIITGPDSVCVGGYVLLSSDMAGPLTSSSSSLAYVSADSITGINTGMATITATNWSTTCSSTHNLAVISTCTGTPSAGTAISSDSLVCGGTYVTLSLPGASGGCGVLYQWQSSPDSATWSDIAGGTHIPYNCYTAAPLYYRCKVTCYTTGISVYSNVVHVSVEYHIISHEVIADPDYYCNGPDYSIFTCGYSPLLKIVSYYGDGSSDTTIPFSTMVHDFHIYTSPGTYSVKQVLYYAATPLDSVSFSYTYNYCRTLPVNFYFDANSDCIYDAGDAPFYMPELTEVDSSGIPVDTISATSGFYYKALGAPGVVYSFRVIGTPAGLTASCPSGGVIYDTIQSYVNNYSPQYIGINCSSFTSFDLSENALISCGRHLANGYITVDNTYCPGEDAVVTMNFSDKYIYGSSYPAPFSVAGNTVTWHISSLSVHTNPQYIWFSLALPPLATWLVTGDTVNTNYMITPYSGDVDTTNNYSARIDYVDASYDPNEMSVMPQGDILPCTALKYAVLFENTGNDTAFNISVMDTLSNNVDPRSLRIISASSQMQTAFIYDSLYTIVKFNFPNINLPDSSHHNQCNGSVMFTIKAKAGLPDGVAIFNHAGIFFDDNPVVMTDTVENIIGISPVAGPSGVCIDSMISIADPQAGGVWSVSNTKASLAAGTITGITAGADTISYTISNACATKTATKIIAINPRPDAGAITDTGSVCPGSSVTLTDTAPGGIWSSGNPSVASVAGGVVSGITTGTATILYTVTNGCGATAAAGTVTVVPAMIPAVAISATPGLSILVGQADTLTAVVTGGSGASSYQWFINGTLIPGATSETFINDLVFNGDNISCKVTSSDPCTQTVSSAVILTLNDVGVKTTTQDATFTISPNPNKGTFTISGSIAGEEDIILEVTDIVGQVVYKNKITAPGGKVNEQVSLGNNIANGIYLLNLHSGNESKIFRVVVGQ